MVEYIKEIANQISAEASKVNIKPNLVKEGSLSTSLYGLIDALAEELDRIDPREFPPGARFEFVKIRTISRNLAKSKGAVQMLKKTPVIGNVPIPTFTKRLIDILDTYSGEGSAKTTRSFGFIVNEDLRTIIERDYRELNLLLIPSGAWKSAVILAGSILEAILYDVTNNRPNFREKASNSPKAPKSPIEFWKLGEAIEVSVDIGLLPMDRANTIDQVLRGYRNFVHPKKEGKMAYKCSEAEAFLAKGALDTVCNHLDATINTSAAQA